MDRHLKRLRQQIEPTVAGSSFEQFGAQIPGKGSTAGEICVHLDWTHTGTLKRFERVASKPTSKNSARAPVVPGFKHLPSGKEAPPEAWPRGLPVETVWAGILPDSTRDG